MSGCGRLGSRAAWGWCPPAPLGQPPAPPPPAMAPADRAMPHSRPAGRPPPASRLAHPGSDHGGQPPAAQPAAAATPWRDQLRSRGTGAAHGGGPVARADRHALRDGRVPTAAASLWLPAVQVIECAEDTYILDAAEEAGAWC